MAPDVDMKVPFVPHCGPTHTMWFAAAVGVAGLLLGTLMGTEYGLLGVIGHWASSLACRSRWRYSRTSSLTRSRRWAFGASNRATAPNLFRRGPRVEPASQLRLQVLGGVVAFVFWAFPVAIAV